MSAEFLQRVYVEQAPLILPTLVLPEVAAPIARGQRDPRRARQSADSIARWPNVRLISLDRAFADFAVSVVLLARLRGSDAVYATVAQRFGTVLVTRDREMRERLDALVPVRTPAEALSEGV